MRRKRHGAVCMLLGAVLALLLCPWVSAEDVALPDSVKISPWAVQEVHRSWAEGLMAPEDVPETDYSRPVSRVQFARLAVQWTAVCRETDAEALLAEYGTETLREVFSDTRDPYAGLAARLGLMQGSGGAFRPDAKLTRAEAAAVLQRCMGLLGRTEANTAPQVFSDAYTIPRWAVEAVKYGSGRTTDTGRPLLSGSGGQFRPADAYSVEQAIVTLVRCYDSRTVDTVYSGWRSAPGYDTVEITVSFGGDCTFGRGRNAAYAGSFDEMYDQKGAAWFLGGISEFQSDDLTMVNFEGALTASDTPREEKPFIFKGRPAYAKILKEGSVDVVAIANNHARDYGNAGLNDTIRYLTPYVAVSGYNRQPVLTVKGVKVGFASNLGWSFDAAQKRFIQSAVQNLRAQGAEIIIFNYHWGEEGSYQSNATQRAIAHYCIDSGADLVIGHHPHVVQEVETYQGKQIAYSLGNLSFGGNRNPKDKNCLIFQQTFSLNLNTRKLEKTTCRAVPYKVSSVDWRNDYRPVPA